MEVGERLGRFVIELFGERNFGMGRGELMLLLLWNGLYNFCCNICVCFSDFFGGSCELKDFVKKLKELLLKEKEGFVLM